jgi:hypothetical protein
MSEWFKTFSKNILLYIAGACCCEVLVSVLIHSEMQKNVAEVTLLSCHCPYNSIVYQLS